MSAYARDVARWLHVLYGNTTDHKRQWLEDAAAAIESGKDVPPPPMEGKTRRPWRAAPARLETLYRMWARHGG